MKPTEIGIAAVISVVLVAGIGLALLFKNAPAKDAQQYQTPLAAQQQSQTVEQQPEEITQAQNKGETMPATTAVIRTSKGDITIELYPDETPKTVANFVQKASSDYYKKLTFHRVEDWVIQGGDPLGTGTGGGKMPTELTKRPFVVGSVGVARGQDITVSNDSQFFICTQDCSWLNEQYTNFGTVTAGMDVVKKIAIGDTIDSVSILK
jgi:peptidyl-prolyl cis-trans isomerase B (cyclophilin B)